MKSFKEFVNESFLTGKTLTTPYNREPQTIGFYINPDLEEFEKQFSKGARGLLTFDGDMVLWNRLIMHLSAQNALRNHFTPNTYTFIYVDPDLSVHGIGDMGEDVISEKKLKLSINNAKLKNKIFNFTKFLDQADIQ